MEYLEIQDFTSDGHVIASVQQNRPVFAMFQSGHCSHCQRAKPAFEELSRWKMVRSMYVRLDSPIQSVRDVSIILDKIHPSISRGIPAYVLFLTDGTRMMYIGNRDVRSMKTFLEKYV